MKSLRATITNEMKQKNIVQEKTRNHQSYNIYEMDEIHNIF